MTNANVAAAAADVSIHRCINILVRWLRSFGQQRNRGHHLSSLAVAALRHVKLGPRNLHRMRAVRRKPFDRGDLGVVRGRHRRLARAYSAPANVYGTSGAETDSAA